MTTGFSSLSERDVRREIAGIRRTGRTIGRSRSAARAFLRKAGIITRQGKLTLRYR